MRDDITLLDENDTIDDIKNEVLYHVAKAAFEDNLDGILARLPMKSFPEASQVSVVVYTRKEKSFVKESC